MTSKPLGSPAWSMAARPQALVIFLENTGRISGLNLPGPVTALVDYVAEEYTKFTLRLHGVWRRYDKVILLEDARATGPDLRAALVGASRTHRVDLLILAHGLPGMIVGYKGLPVGAETFGPLLQAYQQDATLLNLRVVWQMNCYGATLVPMWRALGARTVSGSVGVNWLPEPTMTLFLRRWLRGEPFSCAVEGSAARAERVWRPIYRNGRDRSLHPRLRSSRAIVYGEDVDIGS